MENQVHIHSPAKLHGHIHRRRQFSKRRRLILILAIFLIAACILLIVLNAIGIIRGSWINYISVIFAALGLVFTTFQWLFPVDPSLTSVSSPNGGVGQSPFVDPNLIVWREQSVKKVYEKLVDPNVSAVVLRGINGVGASTLANLTCEYAEEQRLEGLGPFTDKSLWLYINTNTTIPDLAEEISSNLKKPIPDLSHFASQHQAEQLFTHLNTPEMSRLIVLDFKNPLNKRTKDVLADLPGFKEFLMSLNNRSCYFRVLLTSRPWSPESIGYAEDYMREYHVKGLNGSEGMELLQNYDIEGTDDELKKLVKLCDGHAGALVALKSILKTEHPMDLATFLEDQVYHHVWMEEITNSYLDHVYEKLNAVQKELLFAFSIYRKPVAIRAVRAVITADVSLEELLLALAKLTRRSLLIEQTNHYQLHTIVAWYAQQHFVDTTTQVNTMKLQEAHRHAAHYYQNIANHHLSLEEQNKRAELLIEIVWHLSEAGDNQGAYDLMRQENLLKYLL